MSEQTGSVPGTRTPAAPPGGLLAPFLGGVAGAAAMLALYLGLITLAESFRHALQQLRADAVWVALVAGGLGLQTGLYLRVRQIVKGRSAGGQARTGAGTGTSTAGMVACCAHHLTDLSGCARTQAAPAPASSISQPSAAAAAVSTDSQNGIDVKVTLDPSGLARAGGTLRFSFGLDNHSVDLINLDLAAKAVLRPTPGGPSPRASAGNRKVRGIMPPAS